MAFSPAPLVKDFHKTFAERRRFRHGRLSVERQQPDPYSKTFVKKYEARWGEAPTIHSAFGWSGGVLLEAAVKKAGSFNDDKIRAAFLELEMPTLLAGPFKIKAPENKAGWPRTRCDPVAERQERDRLAGKYRDRTGHDPGQALEQPLSANPT